MPALFDLRDVSDMNIVRSAYDKINGKGSFYNDYHGESFVYLQKQMQSLTDSYNELANFRYRAMSKDLQDFEREYIKKQCNPIQIEYIESKKGIISDKQRQKIVDEINEVNNKNKDFWSNVKGG